MQNQSIDGVIVVASGLTRLHPQLGGCMEWEQRVILSTLADVWLSWASERHGLPEGMLVELSSIPCPWSDPHWKLHLVP